MFDTEYLSLIDANKKMKSASWIKFCILSNFQKINSSFVESRAKMNNVGNNSLIKKERNAYDDLFKAYDSLQRENFAIMVRCDLSLTYSFRSMLHQPSFCLSRCCCIERCLLQPSGLNERSACYSTNSNPRGELTLHTNSGLNFS